MIGPSFPHSKDTILPPSPLNTFWWIVQKIIIWGNRRQFLGIICNMWLSSAFLTYINLHHTVELICSFYFIAFKRNSSQTQWTKMSWSDKDIISNSLLQILWISFPPSSEELERLWMWHSAGESETTPVFSSLPSTTGVTEAPFRRRRGGERDMEAAHAVWGRNSK